MRYLLVLLAALLACAATAAAGRDGFGCQALSYSNLTMGASNTARLAFSTPYMAAPHGMLICLTTPLSNITELRVRSVLEGGDLFTSTSDRKEVLDTTRFTSSVGRWGMQQVEAGTLDDVLSNDAYFAHSYDTVRYDDFPSNLASLRQSAANCAVLSADWLRYTRYEITVSFPNPDSPTAKNGSMSLSWWAAPLSYDRLDEKHIALSVRGSKYGQLCTNAAPSAVLARWPSRRRAALAADQPHRDCGELAAFSPGSGLCVRCNGVGSRRSEDGRRCECGPGLIPLLVGPDACSPPLLAPGANLTVTPAPPPRARPSRRASRQRLARPKAPARDLQQVQYILGYDEYGRNFVPTAPSSLTDLAGVICHWLSETLTFLKANRLQDMRVSVVLPLNFTIHAEPIVDQYLLDKANATLWSQYTHDGRRPGVPTRTKGIQWTCAGCSSGFYKDYTRGATVALNPYEQDCRFMNVQMLRTLALAMALSDPAYACSDVLNPFSAASTTGWTYTA